VVSVSAADATVGDYGGPSIVLRAASCLEFEAHLFELRARILGEVFAVVVDHGVVERLVDDELLQPAMPTRDTGAPGIPVAPAMAKCFIRIRAKSCRFLVR
jgi:hypothetical protein